VRVTSAGPAANRPWQSRTESRPLGRVSPTTTLWRPKNTDSVRLSCSGACISLRAAGVRRPGRRVFLRHEHGLPALARVMTFARIGRNWPVIIAAANASKQLRDERVVADAHYSSVKTLI
jgi:hypothetical protein